MRATERTVEKKALYCASATVSLPWTVSLGKSRNNMHCFSLMYCFSLTQSNTHLQKTQASFS